MDNICIACGLEYEGNEAPTRCKICEDPRQFVPPEGQQWSSFDKVIKNHKTTAIPIPGDPHSWELTTAPKFGIGQRAILITTEHGNILWDCVACLDPGIVEFINSKGGLKAIVVSHPHLYTTFPRWAATFDCPVYTSIEDKEWIGTSAGSRWRPVETETTTVLPGVTVVKVGGHFPGSLVMHWNGRLYHADSIMTVPSGLNPEVNRLEATPPEPATQQNTAITYTFLWSIPNMSPLDPDTILYIWERLKPYEFERAYGNLAGRNIVGPNIKARILESARIQVRAMGWTQHALLTPAVE